MFSLGIFPQVTSLFLFFLFLSRPPGECNRLKSTAGSRVTYIIGAPGFPFDYSQVLTIEHKVLKKWQILGCCQGDSSASHLCWLQWRKGKPATPAPSTDTAGPCPCLSPYPHLGTGRVSDPHPTGKRPPWGVVLTKDLVFLWPTYPALSSEVTCLPFSLGLEFWAGFVINVS